MAQDIYWSWQDDDSTFRMNQRDLALMPHGLYFGFNANLTGTSMDLVLEHTNGASRVDFDLNEQTDLGLIRTKQGVIVYEDEPITLPINNGSSESRIDLIVAEHQYEEVTGGTPLIYLVIEGTPSATPVAPALTQPNKQVILGYLNVPALADEINQCTYDIASSPAFANDTTNVKTFNVISAGVETLQEAKGKIFDIVVNKVAEATISTTTLRLNGVTGKYTIENIDNDFKEINSIAVLYPNTIVDLATIVGAEFLVVSDQRIRFNSFLSNFNYETSNDLGQAFIERGEAFILNLTGVSGGLPTFTIRLNEKTLRGKEYGVKSGFQSSTGYDSTTSRLTLSEGNVVVIENDDASNTLAFINKLFDDHVLGSNGCSISVFNSGDFKLTIENGVLPQPTGFANIYTGTMQDETLFPNQLMDFVLVQGTWVIKAPRNYLKYLLDTEIGNPTPIANDDCLICVQTAPSTFVWRNMNFRGKIENTTLFLRRILALSVDTVGIELVTTESGVPYGAFNPSGRNVIRLNLNTPLDYPEIGAIKLEDSTHPMGTVLHLTWIGTRTPDIRLNVPVSNPNFGAIQCRSYGSSIPVSQPLGTTWTFMRNETGWEYFPLEQKARRGSWFRSGISQNLPLNGLFMRSSRSGSLASPTGATVTVTKDEFGVVRLIGGRLCMLPSTLIDSSSVIVTIPLEFRPTNGLGLGTDSITMLACPAYNTATTGQHRMVYFNLNRDNGELRLFPHVSNFLGEFDVVDTTNIQWLSDSIG